MISLVVSQRKVIEVSKSKKLIDRVMACPPDLRLEEAERYLNLFGFELARNRGSHRVYKRKETQEFINLQGHIIREYQVKQIIRLTSDLDIEEDL